MRPVTYLNASEIKLSGDLDIFTRESLANSLRPAERLYFVTLNMRDVTFLDASALGCLMHLRNHMRHGVEKRIRLVDVRPQHARLLRLVQFQQLFEIYEMDGARSKSMAASASASGIS